MNFEHINDEIAKNKLETNAEDARKALNNKLQALRVDWTDLAGKTIKSASKNWNEFTIFFDDDTYLIIEAENDSECLDLYFPNMHINEAVKCGLLSVEEVQPLEDAEKATREAYNEKEGVTNLNNAVAHLGIDAVKELVNNVYDITMKLQDIGFYTLCDERVENLSDTSPMWRCEMILTDRCNFSCPYCRGLKTEFQGDMPYRQAYSVLHQWAYQGLKNVRFSGGEPMLYPHLKMMVENAKAWDVERIALSTNGSFPLERYMELVEAGVNDFSISFDACCASECGKMSGTNSYTLWKILTHNIRELSKVTYVTVGVVLTDDNVAQMANTVKEADSLGVSDIRIIPAAQEGNMIEGVEKIPQSVLDRNPILAYRVANILAGKPVRSIQEYDSHRCYIPIDDSVVAGDYHFPCIIFLREQGNPIGRVGPNMRQERIEWSEKHDAYNDPICQKNCLDVCVDHNNKCAACHNRGHN